MAQAQEVLVVRVVTTATGLGVSSGVTQQPQLACPLHPQSLHWHNWKEFKPQGQEEEVVKMMALGGGVVISG